MKDEILEKIAALRAKVPTNGATEEEAMAALALADKLMQKHGVTEEQLNNIQFKRDMRSGEHEQRQKQIHPSSKFCWEPVSRFCGVRIWNSAHRSIRNKKILKMFGLNGDVEMAEFLMGLIHDSMDRGWKEFLATTPKEDGVSRHTQYWSFMMGFAERVNQKIEDLIEHREATAATTGTDLEVQKSALVEAGLEALLPSLRLKKGKGRGIRADGSAMAAGASAGDRMSLQRPIQQSGLGKKMIT